MPSSVIRKIHYDPGSRILKITFVSGAVYEYLQVPDDVYAGMEQAFSKGHYLNEKILGKYDFRKLHDPD